MKTSKRTCGICRKEFSEWTATRVEAALAAHIKREHAPIPTEEV